MQKFVLPAIEKALYMSGNVAELADLVDARRGLTAFRAKTGGHRMLPLIEELGDQGAIALRNAALSLDFDHFDIFGIRGALERSPRP